MIIRHYGRKQQADDVMPTLDCLECQKSTSYLYSIVSFYKKHMNSR